MPATVNSQERGSGQEGHRIKHGQGRQVHPVGVLSDPPALSSPVVRMIQRTLRSLLGKLPAPSSFETVTIVRDPEVLGGKAVIGGTRIPVFVIEDFYREKGSISDAHAAYPDLEESQVIGAILYAMQFAEGVNADREQYWASIPPELAS